MSAEHFNLVIARVMWLHAGDRNTRFFHLSTIKRRKTNSILRLKHNDNRWLTELDDINGHISNFYKNLFCSSGIRRMEETLEFIDPCVNNEMNEKLMSPVTREEIRASVFSLGRN